MGFVLRFSMLVALVLGWAGASNAAIQTGDLVSIERDSGNRTPDGALDVYVPGGPSIDTYGTGPGGEFRITSPSGSGDSATDQFQTFCIEYNEFISLDGSYYVTINDKALKGGAGGDFVGTPTQRTEYTSPYEYTGQSAAYGDPIGEATKWLYNAFINGQLNTEVASYQYDDHLSANALQNAFWHLEGEIPSVTGLAATLVNAANQAIANGYVRNGYDVLALNLWANKDGNEYSGLKQSQLYWVATSGTEEVPEPATVLVWGGLSAIGCVVAVRRQRRRDPAR